MHHEYNMDSKKLAPLICHVFTKQDRVQPAVKKRNDKIIKNLAKQGIIGNYLYVSAKTGQGMKELKAAVIDAEIKNHGDKIRPPDKPKKKKEAAPNDPYGDADADAELSDGP